MIISFNLLNSDLQRCFHTEPDHLLYDKKCPPPLFSGRKATFITALICHLIACNSHAVQQCADQPNCVIAINMYVSKVGKNRYLIHYYYYYTIVHCYYLVTMIYNQVWLVGHTVSKGVHISYKGKLTCQLSILLIIERRQQHVCHTEV